MCKGSSGGGTNTVVQNSQPPQQVLNQYQGVINQANAVAGQPFQQYGGQLVAGFNPTQTQGFNQIQNLQGVAQPYINQASNYISAGAQPITPQAFSAGQVQQYLSPYTQNVVNATQAQFNNQNQQQNQQLIGNAISSGAWGGDRASVAQAELANQQQLAQAPVIAGLENQAYNQALGEFNTQQQVGVGAQEASGWLGQNAGYAMSNLGNQALNTGLTGTSALLQTGGLQQQLSQEQLNVPYEQFLAQQSFPYSNLSWLSNISTGLGSGMGGSSSTAYPGPSVLGQVAGAGLAGAGLLGESGALSGLFGGGGGYSAAGEAAASAAGGIGLSGLDLGPFPAFPAGEKRGGRIHDNRLQMGGVPNPYSATAMSIPGINTGMPYQGTPSAAALVPNVNAMNPVAAAGSTPYAASAMPMSGLGGSMPGSMALPAVPNASVTKASPEPVEKAGTGVGTPRPPSAPQQSQQSALNPQGLNSLFNALDKFGGSSTSTTTGGSSGGGNDWMQTLGSAAQIAGLAMMLKDGGRASSGGVVDPMYVGQHFDYGGQVDPNSTYGSAATLGQSNAFAGNPMAQSIYGQFANQSPEKLQELQVQAHSNPRIAAMLPYISRALQQKEYNPMPTQAQPGVGGVGGGAPAAATGPQPAAAPTAGVAPQAGLPPQLNPVQQQARGGEVRGYDDGGGIYDEGGVNVIPDTVAPPNVVGAANAVGTGLYNVGSDIGYGVNGLGYGVKGLGNYILQTQGGEPPPRVIPTAQPTIPNAGATPLYGGVTVPGASSEPRVGASGPLTPGESSFAPGTPSGWPRNDLNGMHPEPVPSGPPASRQPTGGTAGATTTGANHVAAHAQDASDQWDSVINQVRQDMDKPYTTIPEGQTERMAANPWALAVAAGAGMMASRNPSALGAIGEGLLQGVRYGEKEAGREGEQRDKDLATQAAQQSARARGEDLYVNLMGLKQKSQELAATEEYRQDQLGIDRQRVGIQGSQVGALNAYRDMEGNQLVAYVGPALDKNGKQKIDPATGQPLNQFYTKSGQVREAPINEQQWQTGASRSKTDTYLSARSEAEKELGQNADPDAIEKRTQEIQQHMSNTPGQTTQPGAAPAGGGQAETGFWRNYLQSEGLQ